MPPANIRSADSREQPRTDCRAVTTAYTQNSNSSSSGSNTSSSSGGGGGSSSSSNKVLY